MPYAPELSATPTITELRSALGGAGEYLTGLLAVPADQRGDSHNDDVASAVNFVNEYDAHLSAIDAAARTSQPPAARGGTTQHVEVGDEARAPRSLGEFITQQDAYTDGVGSYGAGHREINIEGRSLASHESRATISGGSVSFTYGTTDSGGLWRPLGTPIPPVPRQQRLFIRDVLNVIQTGLGAIPYVQELNPTTNDQGATAVAEGNQKPEVTMQFTPALAPVVTIAAWVPVTTQILEDAPTLAGYIDTRLGYMVALREEAEVLNGGGGVNITGIRQTAGLQTQTVVAGDFPASIGLGIGKIENVDLEADFVACNPLNFWVAATTRHANQFDNGFSSGAPAILQGLTWGTTSIRTRAMESGKAIVGSSMAGTIADRMQSVIKIGNQHADFFTGNKVAVLGEERVAFLDQRPDGFCEVSVPTS